VPDASEYTVERYGATPNRKATPARRTALVVVVVILQRPVLKSQSSMFCCRLDLGRPSMRSGRAAIVSLPIFAWMDSSKRGVHGVEPRPRVEEERDA